MHFVDLVQRAGETLTIPGLHENGYLFDSLAARYKYMNELLNIRNNYLFFLKLILLLKFLCSQKFQPK